VCTNNIFSKKYRVFFLTVTLLVSIANGSTAQHHKLLDSARSIFRAQPQKATKLLLQVKDIATKAKDYRSLIESDLIAGNIAYFQGNHDEALRIYMKALKIAENFKLHQQISGVCNEIGTLFKKNKDLKNALTYYERALKEASLANSNTDKANSYNNIGLIFEEEGKYGKALKQYQQSLTAYQKANDKLGKSYSLEYIGYVYGLMKNYDSAIENLLKSLKLREELKDNYGIAICLIELTEIYRDKKDYVKAIDYGQRAIAFSKQINYPDMVQKGYFLLSQIYEKNNDFNHAFDAHKNYVAVKDSIFNIAKSEQINELQTKYDTEQKQQKINLLSKENIIQKLKLRQRDGAIVVISFSFLLFSFITYLLYNRYRLKQKTRLQNEVILQQDLATKAVIEAEENERRRIAGELHDGLGQIFSAVKLNLSAIGQNLAFKDEHDEQVFDKTLSLVDESCTEVRHISHQMAPNVLLKAGLATAVRDFIDKIDARKLKVNLETFGLQGRLDQNIETVLYRVIQETVNNVIKHAGANALDIQLTKDEDGINVMIEDNGKGFDTANIETFDGIGLKNIRSRVEYLKGSVDFSSNLGSGTLVAIHIPL
jgi:two-component system NarL family sensor kinase